MDSVRPIPNMANSAVINRVLCRLMWGQSKMKRTRVACQRLSNGWSGYWSASALLLIASLLLTACGGDNGETTHGVHLVNKGRLTICTHIPYKPFEFGNKDGEIVGFDADMMGLLAKKLDVQKKVLSVPWSTVTSGAVFKADKCDVAMGGATITKERAESVQFSKPYFDSTQALITQTGNGIYKLADLKGKRLGVQTETTGKRYAESHQKEFGYTVVVFDDLALETAAVSAGKVAAGMSDNSALVPYARAHSKTHIVQRLETGEQYGFIAQKNDANGDKLIHKINQVITQAKNDGTYEELFHKWFGQGPGRVGS